MGLRIRAGWTLSVILLIAFALQLVAVLSVPVTDKIWLCEYKDYRYGVFGYCNKVTGECSSVGVGYDVSEVDNNFSLPSSARRSLANLLIVHVVAAGLTLILLVFSLLTFIHGPSQSSKYLLFVFIFSIPTFLISLLAFLVDILLFVSHMSWGGWILLAATILLAFSGIILCVMRRFVSSRKAMKRRMDNTDELEPMPAPPPPPPMHRYSQQQSQQHAPHGSISEYEEPKDEQVVTEYQEPYIHGNDSYQHASARAFRSGRQTPDLSMSSSQQPLRAPDGQYPQYPMMNSNTSNETATAYPLAVPPAGSSTDDTMSMNEIPSGNTYGPNVVPIPRMRPVEQHHPIEQQQQYQPMQGQVAEVVDESSASYDQSEPQPSQHPLAQQQQQQQRSYYDSRSSYVPPRRQWQQYQQQQQQQQPQPQASKRQSQPAPQHVPGNMMGGNTSRRSSGHRQYFQEDDQPQEYYYHHQPTRSEMVIQNNPDFQVAQPSRRRGAPAQQQAPQPPPHQPYEQTQQPSQSSTSLNSSGRKKNNKGMPAAFATNEGPFAASRLGG